jgi:hypothetical protein
MLPYHTLVFGHCALAGLLTSHEIQMIGIDLMNVRSILLSKVFMCFPPPLLNGCFVCLENIIRQVLYSRFHCLEERLYATFTITRRLFTLYHHPKDVFVPVGQRLTTAEDDVT